MNRKNVAFSMRRRFASLHKRFIGMSRRAFGGISALLARARTAAGDAIQAFIGARFRKRSASQIGACRSSCAGSGNSTLGKTFSAVRRAFSQHADAIRYYGVLIAVLAVLATAAIRYRDAHLQPRKMSAEPESRNVAVHLTPAPTIVPRDPLLLPTGEIIGEYSADTLSWSETLSQWQTHPAVDFACAEGEAVLAIADGVVRERAYDPLMGNTIVIDHGDGRIARYASLNTLELVEVGQRVARGDVISAAGTCLAEEAQGAHVHIAYYLNSVPEDVTAVNGE